MVCFLAYFLLLADDLFKRKLVKHASSTLAGKRITVTSLEGWLLTPALLGRTAQMNRVAVFAGLLFWTWMWGIWGTLLAVPMMMVVKVICDHVEDFQPVADFLSE